MTLQETLIQARGHGRHSGANPRTHTHSPQTQALVSPVNPLQQHIVVSELAHSPMRKPKCATMVSYPKTTFAETEEMQYRNFIYDYCCCAKRKKKQLTDQVKRKNNRFYCFMQELTPLNVPLTQTGKTAATRNKLRHELRQLSDKVQQLAVPVVIDVSKRKPGNVLECLFINRC